jgi:hypothetical protein
MSEKFCYQCLCRVCICNPYVIAKKPAGLTPDMLSEEDRELLKFIKGCIDQCGSSPNYAGLWQIYCVPAMRLIDRLLNKGEQ